MFKKNDKVTFNKFGPDQKGEIISNRKMYMGVAMYKVKITSPAGQFGWRTTLREDDMKLIEETR